MEQEITTPQQMDAQLVELVSRAEYDIQIGTAKRYPRSIKQFINDALQMVTLNEDVARGCIYALPRGGKNIEGPSARFAEMALHSWGNCRAGARVVHEDDRFVTAQGICHDLQSNTFIAYEVRRRITDSKGKRFNDDMIAVTANAASSIALRNAILKTIPKVYWSPIYEQARKTIVGDAKTFVNRREDAMALLQQFGVTPQMLYAKLELKGKEDLSVDHLIVINGMVTALKDGDSTVEQMFSVEKKPEAEAQGAAAVKEKLKAKEAPKSENKEPQPAAAEPARVEPAQPEAVNTVTGEVLNLIVPLTFDAKKSPFWTQYSNDVKSLIESLNDTAQLVDVQQANSDTLKKMKESAPTIHGELMQAFTACYNTLTQE